MNKSFHLFSRNTIICLLFLSGLFAAAQSSTEGVINTGFTRNSIIRNINGKLVAYGENSLGESCVMFISNPGVNSNVPSIQLPRGIHVLDFTYCGDSIYFVGYNALFQDVTAIAGKFPISDFSQPKAHMEFLELAGLSGRTFFKPTKLSRLVAYSCDNTVHIVAVGEALTIAQPDGTLINSHFGLFDLVFGATKYQYALSTNLLSDIKIIDDKIVVVRGLEKSDDSPENEHPTTYAFSKSQNPLWTPATDDFEIESYPKPRYGQVNQNQRTTPVSTFSYHTTCIQ